MRIISIFTLHQRCCYYTGTAFIARDEELPEVLILKISPKSTRGIRIR